MLSMEDMIDLITIHDGYGILQEAYEVAMGYTPDCDDTPSFGALRHVEEIIMRNSPLYQKEKGKDLGDSLWWQTLINRSMPVEARVKVIFSLP